MGLQNRSPTGQEETIQLLAPANNTAWTPVLMNSRVFIPANTVLSGALNAYYTYAIFSDAPQAAVAIAVGDKIYWDNVAGKFTNVSTSNTLCGYALEASASGGPTGRFRFDTFAA